MQGCYPTEPQWAPFTFDSLRRVAQSSSRGPPVPTEPVCEQAFLQTVAGPRQSPSSDPLALNVLSNQQGLTSY